MESTQYHIPSKGSFSLNEVCGLTGVRPYVIRFWEAEFEGLKAKTDDDGNKFFNEVDLLKIQEIKKMLYDERLSILEAREKLSKLYPANGEELPSNTPKAPDHSRISLAQIIKASKQESTLLTDFELPHLPSFAASVEIAASDTKEQGGVDLHQSHKYLSEEDLQKILEAKEILRKLIHI